MLILTITLGIMAVYIIYLLSTNSTNKILEAQYKKKCDDYDALVKERAGAYKEGLRNAILVCKQNGASDILETKIPREGDTPLPLSELLQSIIEDYTITHKI
jgi:hypothetical protein